MKQDCTAVVLAGGVGKRFSPFLNDKTLLPFMGESLVYKTLKMIAKSGITTVLVATNQHNHELISGYQKDFPSLSIKTHMQPEPKGMADALLSLASQLPAKDIIVMNAGDMVADTLVSQLLEAISDEYAVVTGMEVSEYQPLGYFELEGERVVGIVEKPGKDNMPSKLANLVFHYFSRPSEFIELLEHYTSQASNAQDDIYEQALSEIMRSENVGCFRYKGSWQKLKYGHDVLTMIEYFFAELGANLTEPRIHADAQVAATATISGPVIIEAGAKIMDHAIIKGPAYIGKNALIGDAALVRGSMIEANAVVGFASEIVRSYIGTSCDLHHVYIGDSVLEEAVHFGFNAHTANYRFDHEPIAVKFANQAEPLPTNRTKLGALIARGADVGVNASLMPGVTIGSHATIFPQAVVYSPVPDNTTLKVTQTQTMVAKTT